ncbi:MAG: DNA methylase [Firmicutes bacterium]|nr:DNA methylase [Bacillota bacterium]
MKQRYYAAIDLKSFYASVECVDRGLDPLKAHLVVADVSRTEKTICLAVSPALKAFGISGRARLFEVIHTLEQIKKRTGRQIDYIAAVPRMQRYIEVSSEIYSIYLKYVAPEDIQIYSVDEVFIDLTAYLFAYGCDPREFVSKLVREVFAQTGITATAGVGTNLYLAKIAMDIVAKHTEPDENGVRAAFLDENLYRKTLWAHRPLTDFWRIGQGTAKRLEKHGMYTMGDIARVSLKNEELLYKLFGIDAEILTDHAWGIEPVGISDIKNYRPSANSLSSGQVLSCPYEYKKARVIVIEMTDKLVLEMVEHELAADSVTLEIGYDRENTDSGRYKGRTVTDRYGRSVPVHAHGTVGFGRHTDSSKEIISRTAELFDRIADPSLTVRRITVTANNVLPESETAVQLDIFTAVEGREKEKRLQKAEIELKRKYGGNAVLRGISFTEGATARERNSHIGGHKA